MNSKLTQRGTEIAKKLMIYLASFDCMTLNQCTALIYDRNDAAVKAGMQRKLKRMIQSRLIGRKKSNDGLYRYYLLEAGVRAANEMLQFEATAGSDRHYMNSSRNDAVIDRMIKAVSTTPGGWALGRGALRRSLGGKYSAFDGLLVAETEAGVSAIRAFLSITTINAISIQRHDKAARLSKILKIPLEIVGPEIAKRYFKTRVG